MRKNLKLMNRTSVNKKAQCWQLFETLWYFGKQSEFVVCKKCDALYKHSSANGTRTINDHFVQCSGSRKLTDFERNKVIAIDPHTLDQMKDSQIELACSAMVSFSLFDNTSFLNFCDNLVSIGAKYGHVALKDIMLKRHAVSDSVFECEKKVKARIVDSLKINDSIATNSFSISTDIWTSDYSKNSYMDVHITWFDSTLFSIRHGQYAMEHIQDHTAVGIKTALHNVLAEIGVVDFAKVNITTDCASNVLKAVQHMSSFKCACHRLNTTIKKAWEQCKDESGDLADLDRAVTSLITNIQHKADIQKQLPVKISTGSQTRAWRGLYEKFNRVFSSYKKLTVLDKVKKFAYQIDFDILKIATEFLKPFANFFDILEATKSPTFNLVVPSYFSMIRELEITEDDKTKENCDVIMSLKLNFREKLEETFWPAISDSHFAATFLDPKYKKMPFGKKSVRNVLIEQAKCEIKRIAKNIQLPTTAQANKKSKIDAAPKNTESKSTDLLEFEVSESEEELCEFDQINSEINNYIKCKVEPDVDMIQFWESNQSRYPTLFFIFKQLVTNNASESLSERIFSIAGMFNTKTRSSLGIKKLAALTISKSGFINELL